jgi:DNA-binding CsgD family transcriptional regulator
MLQLLLAPASGERTARTAPQTAPLAQCLALMLDEIDYGMLLVGADHEVLHANHVARQELDERHPLMVVGRELRLRWAHDQATLRDALADAAERGLRRLVVLGDEGERITLAVVPLAAAATHDAAVPILLVFGKRRVCPALSAHWFARSHGLTPAETRVLAALCEGATPAAIAKSQGVALSTVRTQIGNMRAKTSADSIRDLVRQVAVLPPLVSALRGVSLR